MLIDLFLPPNLRFRGLLSLSFSLSSPSVPLLLFPAKNLGPLGWGVPKYLLNPSSPFDIIETLVRYYGGRNIVVVLFTGVGNGNFI